MEDVLISIVMPCYNAESFITEAVYSVLNQTYKNIQLIIIDDGSNDTSFEKLSDLKNNSSKIILLQQKNMGQWPARNNALKHVCGDYIAFHDADDFWDNQFLEKMYFNLIHRDADVIYCGWQNIGNLNVKGIGGDPYIPPDYAEGDLVLSFLKSCPWPIHAALVKREIVESVNGFSEDYTTSMDYDFWLKILALNSRFVRLPEVLAYYRWHDQGQMSSIMWRQTISAWSTKQKFIQKNKDMVSHINKTALRNLVDGYVLESAYKALWRRDLKSSHKLFRHLFKIRYFGLKEIKYILPCLFPYKMYSVLVNFMDDLASD